MVKVQFVEDKDTKELMLYCTGHADSVEEGSDLVCCAVSTLILTLGQNLKDYKASKFVQCASHQSIKKGVARIRVEAFDDDSYYRLYLLFINIVAGFRILTHNYPDNIQFIA